PLPHRHPGRRQRGELPRPPGRHRRLLPQARRPRRRAPDWGGGLLRRGEDVYIVGGANSAGQAAMYFARYARRVTLLVRGDSLQKGMSQYLVDQICSTANIEVRFQTSVAEARGEESLQELVLRGGEAGALETVPAGSLFILIGAQPRTGWLEGVVERDANGFLLSGPDLPADGNGNGHRRPRGWPLDRDPFLLETSVPGVFVAGDVRHGSV